MKLIQIQSLNSKCFHLLYSNPSRILCFRRYCTRLSGNHLSTCLYKEYLMSHLRAQERFLDQLDPRRRRHCNPRSRGFRCSPEPGCAYHHKRLWLLILLQSLNIQARKSKFCEAFWSHLAHHHPILKYSKSHIIFGKFKKKDTWDKCIWAMAFIRRSLGSKGAKKYMDFEENTGMIRT